MTSQAYKLHVSNIGELWQYFRILLCNDETFWGCLTYLSSFMWSHPVLYHRNGSGTRQQSSLSLRNLISYVIQSQHWKQRLPKVLVTLWHSQFRFYCVPARCFLLSSLLMLQFYSPLTLKFWMFSLYIITYFRRRVYCTVTGIHSMVQAANCRASDPFLSVEWGLALCYEAGNLSQHFSEYWITKGSIMFILVIALAS